MFRRIILAACAALASGAAMAQTTNNGPGTNPTFGAVWQATGVVANSSHAGGTSIGGLTAINAARNAGLGGWITGFNMISPGASVGSYVVRLYQSSPAAGAFACADNAAFVDTSAAKLLLIAPPFTIAPAAPGSTTGDAATYGQIANVAWPFLASVNQNVYACVVTVSADTADQANPLILGLDVVQN
jgi:hypothetical protein